MKAVTHLLAECIECGICTRQCAFLQEASNPKILSLHIVEGTGESNSLNGCTLCGLCAKVCPKDIDIPTAFLEIKRAGQATTVCRSARPLLQYQRIQSSALLSLHEIPTGSDTVFFPGCSFATTRGQCTLDIFSYLQKQYPLIGVVLSCCGKPSNDFGLDTIFAKHFAKVVNSLKEAGISRIITTCPNCQYTFEKYSDLHVLSIYQVLESQPVNTTTLQKQNVSVHDSCTARNAPYIHKAIRSIITSEGGTIVEMPHNRDMAFCCGDGSATSLTRPDLAKTWQDLRHKEFVESTSDTLITYCAGCADNIQPSSHILDVIFGNHMSKETQSSNIFARYFKRYTLKKTLRNLLRHTKKLSVHS